MFNGLVRDVCSHVPPVRSIVRTIARFSSIAFAAIVSGCSRLMLTNPPQPCRRPTAWSPSSSARFTRALMHGFKPGTSPPPVRIPTRLIIRLHLDKRTPTPSPPVSGSAQHFLQAGLCILRFPGEACLERSPQRVLRQRGGQVEPLRDAGQRRAPGPGSPTEREALNGAGQLRQGDTG